jgi:Uma2 family endonuclease
VTVIEVLSPSTERRDRAEKLPDFKREQTIREIVLIDSDRPFIERIARGDAGQWLVTDAIGLDAVLMLTGTGTPIEIPLAELYAGLALPPPPQSAEGEGEPNA